MRTSEGSGPEGYVVEVLPDRHAAEEAVDELIEAGLAGPGLEQAMAASSHHVVDFDPDAFFLHALVVGVVMALPVGILVTMGLVAMAASFVGAGLDTGLLGGAVAGAFLAVLFGGVAGVAASNRASEAAEWCAELPLEADEVLVAVAARETGDSVRSVLERHGGHELGVRAA